MAITIAIPKLHFSNAFHIVKPNSSKEKIISQSIIYPSFIDLYLYIIIHWRVSWLWADIMITIISNDEASNTVNDPPMHLHFSQEK